MQADSNTRSAVAEHENTSRESTLLPDPPTFYVSQAEIHRYECLKVEALDGRFAVEFSRMLVILALNLSIVAPSHWIGLFNPAFSSRTGRYQILQAVHKLAQSASAKPDLQVPPEVWQDFLRPILSAGDPCLSTIALRTPPFFQSTPVKEIEVFLDRLGLHTDPEKLLDLRQRLDRILPRHLIRESQVFAATSLSHQNELAEQFCKVQALLDGPIDGDFITIIALSHCQQPSTILAQLVSDTGPQLFSRVMQQFHNSSSPRVRLALLVVAYVIQFYLFGPVSATSEEPHLPESLSEASYSHLSEAVRSYAVYIKETNLLGDLAAPVLQLDKPLSPNRKAKWWGWWYRDRPPNWPSNSRKMGVSETRKELSMMSDDTEIQRSRWTAFFSCLRGIRDHRTSL